MSGTYPVRRPFLLSLVTILMMIGGTLQIIAGVVLMLFRNNDELRSDSGESSSTLLTLGVIAVIFGLIHIWFATALRRGNRFARALVLVFEILQIVGGVWTLIALHSQYRVNALITIVISLFVIWYLYGNERSRAFFGDNPV
jgi:predicted permease